MTQPIRKDSDPVERQEPTPNPSEEQTARTDGYTLKVVFSGIVPLVPEYNQGIPTRLWALVSNLKDPSKLPPLPDHLVPEDGEHNGSDHGSVGGHESQAHRNRFLVQPDCLVSVGHRTRRTDAEVCGETSKFDYVELNNEHLTLVQGPEADPLEIVRGEIRYPVPCKKGEVNYNVLCDVDTSKSQQELDFGWVLSVDQILAGTTCPGKDVPKLQTRLFASSYEPNPPNSVPLLSARLAFEHGRVTTRTLDKDALGNYRVYRVDPWEGEDPLLWQAVATRVEVSVRVQGPVTFEARALSDADAHLQPIIVDNAGKHKEVTVFVENQPENLDCSDLDQGGRHFYLNYHLLDHPDHLRGLREPVETSVPPVLNAQCSPPKFSSP